ncbi:type II secretion system F family protein [Thermaurantiacus sp.]
MMQRELPALAVSPEVQLAALAVGALVFATALAAGLLLHPAGLERRARALGAHADSPQTPRARGAQLLAWIDWAIARLSLVRATERRALARTLALAGFRAREAVSLYLATRLLAPLAGALLGLAAGPHTGLAPTAAALAGAGLGLAAPPLFLANRRQRRRQAIERGFPDALDLLVICVESGLSVDAAIARVAGELGRAHPVLAAELQLAAVELRFLPDRADAFANLEARTGIEGIRALVSMLHQTERFGTPLAQALRTLAAEARTAALLRVEERAARLPAVLTVPMIFFILPPLFIVLVGPVIAQLLSR